MREISRNRPEGQIWITRAQLGALGATAAAVAALTFFLGLMLGRQASASAEAATAGAAERTGLIAPEVSADALPELLAQIERARGAAGEPGQLTFPDDLPADEPASLVPQERAEEMGDPAIAHPATVDPPTPPLEGDGVPDQGWAVEVGVYAGPQAADTRVGSLREEGLEAWRVESFEQGMTRFRVRVGAWSTKAEAADALGALRDRLGQDDLVVTGVR